MKDSDFTSSVFSTETLAQIVSTRQFRGASSADDSRIFQRGLVYLIACGHFVNDVYTGFLSPLLPLLMERMQFPLSRAGMLASVLSASSSLSQPIFGALNDRFNRRFFVFLAPLISGVFICSLGYIPVYWMLIPILLLCGLGSAIFHPSAAAMVGRVSGNRKEWGMSLFVTSGNFGHSLAPLLVVPVVTYFGLRKLPLLIFPAILMAFMLFRRLPEPETLLVQPKFFLSGRQRHSPRLPLFLHFAISVLRSLVISGFGTFIPIYMHAHGYSLFSAGATITVFQAIGAIGALLSGHFAARFDRRRIIMFSLLAAVPLLVSFVYFPGTLTLLALALSGILLYFSFPLNVVMAQELYPHRASMVSALMIGVSWGSAGLMMTPLGFIAEKAGLQNALLALALIGVLAGLIASFLPKKAI
ncbi:MAG: MFS transporter [candidate division KSB1 bacterium]|nr:MFS transporter [candidate division KSB1 bacterium]MDZ7301394.1 MFS transporter [candidate division KSB1 bacterium]MDZ7310721.1 MFS transporter [candidate division KSB1 bacterium]